MFGRNVAVYQWEYYKRFKGWGIKDRLTITEYLKFEGIKDLFRHVEFFLMGRSPYALRDRFQGVYPRYPASAFFTQPCRPPFLRNWHNHFDNYGNYIPGYCGGITLGDCRDLEALMRKNIDAETYPVLDFLIRANMEGLLTFAGDFGYRETEDGYFSKCHLCIDVRKHLALQGDFAELRPKAFYTHLE